MNATNNTGRRNRPGRWTTLVAILLAFALIAAACGSDDDAEPAAQPSDDSSSSDDSSGSDDDADLPPSAIPAAVTIAHSGPVLAVNPGGPGQNNLPSVQIFFATYDSLVNWGIPSDPDALAAAVGGTNAEQAQPELAESWDLEVLDDGSAVYTFQLRAGVMSEFGREMTAEDVKWSIEKGLTDATGGFWMFVGGMCVGAFGCLDGSGIEVIDDLTLEITLATNEDKFLPTLGTGWLVIYDSVEVLSHATDEDPFANEWLNQNTAGFGPYRITDFGPGGESVTLEAREDYWGEQPALQTVTQRSVPDANTRLQLLLSGDAAYAAELGILALDEVRESDGATVTAIPTTTGAFLALTYEPPFDDLAVRAAIAQAIPYDDIIDVVFRGSATAWDSLLIPPVPGYDNSGFLGTDLDAARAVLSELDAPLTLAYAEGLPVDEEIAILVQSSFREAGFDLQLDKQPRADFDGRKYGRTGELQFFVDAIDVPAFFDAQYYTNLYGGAAGFSNFMNYGSDELNATLAGMLDPATKDQAVADAQAIFARDFPIYPIAWTGLDYAHADYVELNKVVTGNGLLRIQDFVAAE